MREALILALAAFCGFGIAAILFGGELARVRTVELPRSVTCARGQAVLVADTLCARPDSAWRVGGTR